MLFQFWLILTVAAVASGYLGFRWKRWLVTLFSFVLFVVLAWGSMDVEVISGGVMFNFGDWSIVILMLFGAFVTAVLTLMGLIDYIKNPPNLKEKGPMER